MIDKNLIEARLEKLRHAWKNMSEEEQEKLSKDAADILQEEFDKEFVAEIRQMAKGNDQND